MSENFRTLLIIWIFKVLNHYYFQINQKWPYFYYLTNMYLDSKSSSLYKVQCLLYQTCRVLFVDGFPSLFIYIYRSLLFVPNISKYQFIWPKYRKIYSACCIGGPTHKPETLTSGIIWTGDGMSLKENVFQVSTRRSCSSSLWEALDEEGCIGLVPWHLELLCNSSWIMNDFFTGN